MTTKQLGPGPGAYRLPSEVGYDNHDVRKKRLPQYSFGGQTKILDKRVSPGPGGYNLEKITRYGYNKAHQYTIGAKLHIAEKSRGPGPGAHNLHIKPFFKGSNAPAYTITPKNDYQFKIIGPGPNAYMFGVHTIKPSIPAITMGVNNPIEAKPRSPGPAQYGSPDLNTKLQRSPAYSITPRNVFMFKNFAPGSNIYNLTEHKPGKKGIAYSFGVRHSEYAPPMIVECDN